tara:strand:+ start:4034 stop:4333 length:300 start_codon:yes stop_codon:yes gene_type:complete
MLTSSIELHFGGKQMLTFLRKFRKDDSGATAIEYGLIAALVSVAAITALGLMGTSLDNMFTTVSTELTNATNSASSGTTGGTTGGDTGGTTGGTTGGGS